MGKKLTEQKVLKKLKIDNFRQLTKDKVITMASMLDKMDPEVAKKALEQFPQFSNVAKEMLVEYKDVLEKGLKSNDESVRRYCNSCDITIKALEKMLDRDNLSLEQRMQIIEKMNEISDKIGQKDLQNKKFIAAMGGAAMVAVCTITALLASALGGNTKIDTNDFDNFS